MKPSFEELAQQAQQGDKKAYAQLLTQLSSKGRAFILKRLSQRNDVEDIVQEILLSIHHTLPTYQPQQPFEPWFYTICRYRLMDHLRSSYRKNAHESNLEEPEKEDSEEKNVTETLENREQVNKALQILSEKQRKIVLMMKVHGYSAAEVALKMNMNLSAVKVTAHRALKKMKDVLDD